LRDLPFGPEPGAEGSLDLVAGLLFEVRNELLDGRPDAAGRDQSDFRSLSTGAVETAQDEGKLPRAKEEFSWLATILHGYSPTKVVGVLRRSERGMSYILRRVAPFVALLMYVGGTAPAQIRLRQDPIVYQDDGRAPLPKPQPLSRSVQLAAPGRVRLNPLSAEESQKFGTVGGKRRIGLHRDVPSSALRSGTWTTLDDGRRAWRLVINSASASGVRVHFNDFSVGQGQVWLYPESTGTSTGAADGPYSGNGPWGNGEFWSSTIESESVVLEYAAEAGFKADTPPFRVQQLSHQASRLDAEIAAAQAEAAAQTRRALLAPPSPLTPFTLDLALASIEKGTLTDSAASCEADMNCYPAWTDAKRSVAHIQFEETQGDQPGTYVCSAALLATRDNSLKPYLLTAGHCLHNEAAARSLQTWWAYESPGCNLGRPADRGTLKSSNGGHLLAWGTLPQGDYSLVLLPDVPAGVVFSGWDPSDQALGTKVVGIHHPTGSYKRISFGHTVVSDSVVVEGDQAPAALYTTVSFDRGIVEPGSSGSPLFTGPGVIIGMLTYGPALPGEQLCQGSEAAGYGKFSIAYPHLRAWLENLPATQVKTSVSSLQFTGLNHQITSDNSQSVVLTVETASSVPVGVRPDAPWLNVSTESGQLSASTPLQVRVSVDPKYLYQSGRYTSTITILSGAADPQYINVTADMKLDVSNVSVSASPNPVPPADGVWTLKLHLAENAGSDTKLTGLRIDGDDYSAQISTWFGTQSLPANGSLDGTIHVRGLFAPVDKYFEFFGQDAAIGGRQWYRSMTVTFTP
jgi:lysyl endopeptidase